MGVNCSNFGLGPSTARSRPKMSTAKYDLLASKVTHFDAVEMRNNQSLKKNRASRLKCVIIGIVVALLSIAALTLVVVVIVESTRHSKKENPTSLPPIPQCPVDLPEVQVPCSTGKTYAKSNCTNECCWYSGTSQCLLDYPFSCDIASNNMFNCLPENDNWNSTYAQTMCRVRGCCWNSAGGTSHQLSGTPPFQCFYPAEYGYIVQTSSAKETENGKIASIVRKSPQPSMYSSDIDKLSVEITYETSHMLRVKVKKKPH